MGPDDIGCIENIEVGFLKISKSQLGRLTVNEGTRTDSKGNQMDLSEYTLDHLSVPVQQPGNRIKSAIVFHSKVVQSWKEYFGYRNSCT